MPVRWGRQERQGHNKRSSERDMALVQMQIASQARNQNWHEYLCEKRDELQSRLRQQGYSQRSGRESHVDDRYGHRSEMPNVANMTGETDTSSVANPVTPFGVDALGNPLRGGAAAPEGAADLADLSEPRNAKTIEPGENNGDSS